MHEGKRFPPKAILGLAARRVRGRILDPNEFSGGVDSKCFAVLRNLGFEIAAKEDAGPAAGLPVAPPANIWLENTKSAHQHGGHGWEFGTCVWSPSKQ